MRTVLISLVLATSTLSACSLYFDDSAEHKGNLGGLPDAGLDHDGGVPDAGLDHDGGGGGSGCSDGGVEDGGSWHPDGGIHDAGAPDAYDQDAGAAPDAHV